MSMQQRKDTPVRQRLARIMHVQRIGRKATPQLVHILFQTLTIIDK
jgi:hypothetical protein